MKRLEFETSKGMFCINDNREGISLKKLTESKCKLIVDEGLSVWCLTSGYKNYLTDRYTEYSAVKSFESFLERYNIFFLKNPVEKQTFPTQHTLKNMQKLGYGENDFIDIKYDEHQYYLAEQKTFYNPYIFKL